jgi:hypothetical protein
MAPKNGCAAIGRAASISGYPADAPVEVSSGIDSRIDQMNDALTGCIMTIDNIEARLIGEPNKLAFNGDEARDAGPRPMPSINEKLKIMQMRLARLRQTIENIANQL